MRAGNFTTGPHAACDCCEQHLDDVRAWAFRITNDAAEQLAEAAQRVLDHFEWANNEQGWFIRFDKAEPTTAALMALAAALAAFSAPRTPEGETDGA